MIYWLKKKIKRLYFSLKYKKMKVKLSHSCEIGISTVFEGHNVIGEHTSFSGYLGYGSYIGKASDISGKIGRYCSIAPDVCTIQGQHPTHTFVSTHPSFFSAQEQAGFTYVKKNLFPEYVYADENKHAVVIGNDVWIGQGAKILSGVTIGDGAVIAAGAVVIKDVAPYSIVAGVPAKVIRHRFDDGQIRLLLEYKWWEKPIEWIQENSNIFRDIDDFLRFINDEVKNSV